MWLQRHAGSWELPSKADGWTRAQANDRARLAEAVAALAAERAALEEAALPLMLEAMWAANTLDIQHTVKAVCQQVPCCSSGAVCSAPPVAPLACH